VVPIGSGEALVATAETLVASVEALIASTEVLMNCTDVAGSSGCFFDLLPLSTSLGLYSLLSRADFLGTIPRVLISFFIPNLAAIF
jgi:hypothetical protein